MKRSPRHNRYLSLAVTLLVLSSVVGSTKFAQWTTSSTLAAAVADAPPIAGAANLAPAAQPSARCVVQQGAIKLRRGPGVSYKPELAILKVGTQLMPLGRDASSTWIAVQVIGNSLRGWVGNIRNVVCSVPVKNLAVIRGATIPNPSSAATATRTPPILVVPPPPTATRSAVAAASPTPTVRPTAKVPPPILVVTPIENDELRWFAQIIHPKYEPAAVTSLWFRVESYDLNVGTTDGEGIEYVDFRITDQNGILVYDKRERNKAYCAFGGDTPICPPFIFATTNYAWPKGDTTVSSPIESGGYFLDVKVKATNRTVLRTGSITFGIEIPASR